MNIDFSSKPINVANHVIKRARERSRDKMVRRYPDISIINDVCNRAEGYAFLKVNGKMEIRVFSRNLRQYRIVEEENCFTVVTMIQHSEHSVKIAWKRSRGKKIIVENIEKVQFVWITSDRFKKEGTPT